MSSNNEEWETPRWLYDKLDATWHFDLDAASSDENALCEHHFTKSDNALIQDWGGYRVWLNPPYGRSMGDWMKKAAMESRKPGTIVVCLIPARTDTAWYWDWVVPYAAEIQPLRGRVRYCLGGRELNSSPFPSMLVRFGGELPKSARPNKA